MGDCLSQCSPGAPRPRSRGPGAGSRVTSGSTAGNEVCLPITYTMHGWAIFLPDLFVYDDRSYSSHKDTFIPRWMLNIWGGGVGGTKTGNVLCLHNADITCLSTLKNKNLLLPHKELWTRLERYQKLLPAVYIWFTQVFHLHGILFLSEHECFDTVPL